MKAQSKPHPGLLPMSIQRMKPGRRTPHVPTAHDRYLAYLHARGPFQNVTDDREPVLPDGWRAPTTAIDF